MDRLACVNVPELPLQLLLREHPEWAAFPAAVVAEDKPHAALLWVNERGRRAGLLPGQRYSAALALCGELRAATVTDALIDRGVDQLCAALRRFSPHIEAAAHEPGTFWIDASGLRLLYASSTTWARSIERALRELGLTAVVVVGFRRFFTYAVARANRQAVICFRDEHAEKEAALSVPLSRLLIDPDARDTLAKLGVQHVQSFLALSATSLLERFGPELRALHALASGDTWAPLQPTPEVIPLSRRYLFDDGERDVHRLLFIIKHELDLLIRILGSRQQALLSLHIRCKLETGKLETATATSYAQTITPAEPTLDTRQILDLVRLRLEAAPLPAAAIELEVEALGIAATVEQLRLLTERIRRDLSAADRALARVRAELGPDSVTHAALQDACLPEASFRFQPLDHVKLPRAIEAKRPVAVRRLWSKPREISHNPLQQPHVGPFMVQGGWWSRQISRHYYFVEARDGELLYCFFDAERGRWVVHGAL